MKRVMLAVIIAGSCMAGEAPNHLPQNMIPQQQVLRVMMMHAALDGRVQMLEQHKPNKLSNKKRDQNQRIFPKTQKFPKQKNTQYNQLRSKS